MPFVAKFDLLKRPGTPARYLVQGDIEKKSQVYREHWDACATEEIFKIFPLISRHPEMAVKITGMMLEMDNPELLMLLRRDECFSCYSPDQLQAKVDEARRVLSGRS